MSDKDILTSQKEYSVNDLIKALSNEKHVLTRNKLINYEKRGLLKPRYTVGGYRLYSREDLKQVILILDMLDIGFSIENIFNMFNWKKELESRVERSNEIKGVLKFIADNKKIDSEKKNDLVKWVKWFKKGQESRVSGEVEQLQIELNKKSSVCKRVKEELFGKIKELNGSSMSLFGEIDKLLENENVKAVLGN